MAENKEQKTKTPVERVIPPPRGDRKPLKTNVYQFVKYTKTQLAPMFPYFDEGALMPCTATFRGGANVNYGRFQHFNTVDEIVLTFGADGARRGGGVLHVGPKLHMVQCPFENSQDPDSLAVLVITQRQSIGREQREEYRFVCDECDRMLYKEQVDATPPKRGTQREVMGAHASAPVLVETLRAARNFNASEDLRTCKHCGHVNDPFPADAWGWHHYVDQSDTSKRAHDVMKEVQA